MATVTISAENLQLVYSQLNFLRNYVGIWSLDWNEYVVSTNAAPAHTNAHHPAAAPAPAVAPAVAPVAAPAAAVVAPVVTEVPEVVLAAPVKRGFF